MKFGLLIPNSGPYNDALLMGKIAVEVEQAGWDGMFIWDQILGLSADPWVTLGIMASQTKKIRLGPLITPVARRRPWKLAKETVTIDRISNGRLTMGAGLGEPSEAFSYFGEESNNRIRAEKLDEGLDVLAGMWSADEFDYSGKHYKMTGVEMYPKPVQHPRIPIWIGGLWPNKKPVIRAARWEGIAPGTLSGKHLTPAEMQEIRNIVIKYRDESLDNFDFVMVASTPPDRDKAAKIINEYESVGTTWWLESIGEWAGTWPNREWLTPEKVQQMRERIRLGPK